ncbi:SEC14-like protein 2 [Orchesella cincta]|uniref:SEC14-like protein 2 n=1 Tax=Orchesella cincta TaxID=48709 RepID=A0A1D2NHV8_ORCCI|nr:SEC14-like protein 2 [Orchesella cincta]
MDPSNKEVELVEQLRSNLSDLNLSKQESETKNLLRFIRARSHSIENAENMFRRQLQWREQNDMENSVHYQHPKEFKSYWPWYITGFDDSDGPVIIVPIGLWDAGKVTGNYNEFVKYCYNGIETVWRTVQQTSQGQNGYNQFSVVLDLKGANYKQVTNLDAMQGVLEVVKAFEANYPETLKFGLLINAPYVFEMAWKLIKPFISEATHAKLKFLGSDCKLWREELLQYMNEDQFFEKYGGTMPDCTEIAFEKRCAKRRGSNSNEYICDSLMRS